jgi:hypothetical protein
MDGNQTDMQGDFIIPEYNAAGKIRNLPDE